MICIRGESPGEEPGPMSETVPTRSTLNRPWVLKMLIFILVVLGFGSWGYYDAAVVYPARGEKYADWAQWQYLQASVLADQEEFGWTLNNASVTDPVAELEHLSSEEESARNQEAFANPDSRSHRRATAKIARLRWLEGLKLIGRLKPEHTTIENPRQRIESLQSTWASSTQPKPLHGLDIPMQWGIMVICYLVGAYLIVLFLRVAVKKYSWDPDQQRLTLPGGASLVPSDLAEIDKRKWDKFIVFLKVREGHEQLGGQEPARPVRYARDRREHAPGRGHADGHAHPMSTAAIETTPPATDEGVKHFVLDTNVLLHNPGALFVFQENHVVIPYPVIEELDTMKRREDDIGRSARECIRHLDKLRQTGELIKGVRWDTVDLPSNVGASTGANGQTGTIAIDVGDHDRPHVIAADTPDNRIIAVAWNLNQQPDTRAVFVSKDLAARIKSDALGIRTEDFENQKIDADRLYTGYLEIDAARDTIDDLYRDRMLPIEQIQGSLTVRDTNGDEAYTRELTPNQFVILKDIEDEAHSGIGRRLADTDHLIPVTGQKKPTFGVMARNVQQTMALDLLLDDEIKMITLLGAAGTGKTLLALAAGMAKVFTEQRYDKLLVARPIMPMGRDIGYLPGDKDEKLGAWMQPIFDNLSYLMSTRGSPNQNAESIGAEQRIDKLIGDGRLVLEPLTYIRGRSIPHQFMIVDEAQNLTPHEVKTIASRVGEGAKLILTGDIGQIDNPYLDQSSNGLSYTVEKMRGIGLVGHVTLAKSERSELASLAARLL
eukprot:g5409.t1